jgi:pyruvate/2-oxoglutarate dehydrogenase complex dihydrolipoamide dehydrogenase (E3) component
MDIDVAVLGGGPAATPPRSAPLGARVACIEQAPELGGTSRPALAV